MSEKNKAGLNEVDMQAVVAAWIIAHDGCEGDDAVGCYGDEGIFKGVVCPLYRRRTGCIAYSDTKVVEAKAWLDKYHQQKAEAAEIEKRKAEAVKKQEQEAKKTCGECRHIYDADGSVEIGLSTTLCHKKSIRVPVEFTGCHDFEQRNTTCQSPSVSSEGVADAVAYAERIAQLEKENARLAEEVSGYKERARRALGLCEVVKISINQGIKELEELQNQRNLAREDALLLGKENSSLSVKCERLTWQRNKLSNDLIQATRRVKEVERENGIDEQLCSLQTGLIDQLRKENAKLRSALEQAAEDRKHLVGQLSESKQTLPPPMYLYAMGVTAEEFLAMKGRCRQKITFL